MPLTFSSSDRNSSGGYSVSSGTYTSPSGSTSSSSTSSYIGPGSDSFNSYYSPGGAYDTSTSYLSSSSGGSDSGSSYTAPSTTSSGTTSSPAPAPEPVPTDTSRNLGINTRDQYDMQRRGLMSETAAEGGNIASNPNNDQFVTQVGMSDIDPSNSNYRDQFGTTLATYTDAEGWLRTNGYIDEADQVRGLGNAHAASVTYNGGDTYYRDEWKDADKQAISNVANAGDMQAQVMLRNSPGDGVGPLNMRQAKFAGTDTYAADRRTLADGAAAVADTIQPIPFIKPFQGMVDASQGNDMSQWYYNEDSSSEDKWATGMKTAMPFVRDVGGLLGAAQYDNYGKPATNTPNMSGDSNPIEYLKKNNIDPQSPEGQAYLKNWYQQYSGHNRNFVRPDRAQGGRVRQYRR